jgi:hypothetical protein
MQPNTEQAKPKQTRVRNPNTYKSGPDPLRHSMYRPFSQRKAQADFRNEIWELTFDEFADFWKDYWHLRGRTSGDYHMTRIDKSKPWNINNIRFGQHTTGGR